MFALLEIIKPSLSRYTKSSLSSYMKHLKKELKSVVTDVSPETSDMKTD